MENVPGPYIPTQHTDDTKMASAFMDRVFGVPMLHDADVSGDLATGWPSGGQTRSRRSFTPRMNLCLDTSQ